MFEDLLFPTSWVSASLMNLSETEDSFIIELRATGLSKDDISITTEDNVLIVRSNLSESGEVKWLKHEFRPDKINKKIELPYGCDLENIKAKVDLGILTITVPKDCDKTKKKTILIE